MSDSVVTEALHSLTGNSKAMQFLRAVARSLVSGAMDWRTSKAPGLSEDDKLRQGSYRGSSGYTSLQQECVRAMQVAKVAGIAEVAKRVADLAGYK